MKRDGFGVAQKLHPHVQRVAAVRGAEVLEQEGDAAKRPVGDRSALRRRARLLEERHDHGIELRVDLLNSRDRRIDQLERRDLARAQQLDLVERIEVGKIVGPGGFVLHRRTPRVACLVLARCRPRLFERGL